MWLRWPLLVAMFEATLGLLFRHAPGSSTGRGIPLCCGVLTATVLCLLASTGISFYAGLANYGRLFGALGSVALILFWLYACALTVLIGAEIDAVLTSRQDNPREPCDRQDDPMQRSRVT